MNSEVQAARAKIVVRPNGPTLFLGDTILKDGWFGPDLPVNAAHLQDYTEVWAEVDGSTYHLLDFNICHNSVGRGGHYHFRLDAH